MDKAYKAQKAIQDYVFTDGTAEKSVERKFAENLDRAEEVFIYAKLPKGFYIPTPVGHYSPDWSLQYLIHQLLIAVHMVVCHKTI